VEHGSAVGDKFGARRFVAHATWANALGGAGAWVDFAVGRLPGFDVCPGPFAGDDYLD